MKILVVSQHFWPESFKINDLVTELVRRGHEVSVITGKPNYPEGKFYNGYGFFSKVKGEYNGATVYRIPIFARGDASGFKLAINYLSFALFASIFALFHPRRYDASFVFATSPIIMAFPAMVHRAVYGTPFGLWVQDLWPECVAASERLNSGFIYRQIGRMVRYIYKKADRIYISSKGFRASVMEKGADGKKIHYLPNWAEDIFLSPVADSDQYKDVIPGGFVVMFAGNISEGQGVDYIVKAATETADDKEIKWVFVGSGSKKEWLEAEVAAQGLSDTVFLPGRFPLDAMPQVYSRADVLLVTLKDNDVINLTLPSRTQSYMAFGKPVMAMINGAGYEVVKESGCGFAAHAADHIALANNVRAAKALGAEALSEMGGKGRKYYHDHFSKDVIVSDLVASLGRLGADRVRKK